MDGSSEDDEPIYRFSWRRAAVVTGALLTLPIWAPWVKEHLIGGAAMLIVPFILIFVLSLIYVTFAFSRKSSGRNQR